MSNDDTKGGLDAKTPGDLSQQFNIDNRLGASIAKATPEAQKDIWKQFNLSAQTLEKSEEWQKDKRGDRVDKERARLLERYMNDPAPRPNTPEARQQDMKIIDEQSEANVTRWEDSHKESVKRVTKSQVYQILQNDREQYQSQQQAPEQGHTDPEREQER